MSENSIHINLKGDLSKGEQVKTDLTIEGCSCRMEDFTMALIKFTNEWIDAADVRDNAYVPTPGKPCQGCPGAEIVAE